MPITINGSGTVTGISAGGLPDATVTPADLTQPLTLGTSQASTSGTFIDFTGIPSWVKRVTVIFNGVSLSGTSNYLVQIGSGSIDATGYVSGSYGTNNTGVTSTAGLILVSTSASLNLYASVSLLLVNSNNWLSTHQGFLGASTVSIVGGGSKALSGTLDRIRITTVNGTDTFDAGSINILYE